MDPIIEAFNEPGHGAISGVLATPRREFIKENVKKVEVQREIATKYVGLSMLWSAWRPRLRGVWRSSFGWQNVVVMRICGGDKRRVGMGDEVIEMVG